MKIARVNHFRCGEYDAHTLVWVPDDWTLEDFEAAVELARKAYQSVLDSYKNEPAPNDYRPHGKPNYAAHPDWPVRDVDAEWVRKGIEWSAWNDAKKAASRGFVEYLKDWGLTSFWDHDPEFSTNVHWGHQHGVDIDYSEEESEDLRGPAAYKHDDFM